MNNTPENPDFQNSLSRRSFIGKSAAAAVGTSLFPSITHSLSAKNPDKIKLGLIGCGNRGTGAVMDAIMASPNVELTALADVFPEKIENALSKLSTPQKGRTRNFAEQYGSLVIHWDRVDAIKVSPERCFSGFSAYKELLDTDVDVVIAATPPGFRPQHIRAAVEANKHMFAEKPVAVDPAGVRSVLESSALAKKKSLGLMGGTQLRFSRPYVETINRIHRGDIGEIRSAECFWWHDYFVKWHALERQPQWSDVEFQVRCWPHFVWASGDHIVENLVHNIVVMNWMMGSVPVSASALGGHANWEEWPVKGNVFDHFYVEYDYPNGAKGHASSRQIKKCSHRVGERISGTKGTANPFGKMEGENPYEYSGSTENPRFLLWRQFIQSIRDGNPLNHGVQVAESTMTAVLGRMSAYTGRTINYDWALHRSQLDLVPKKLEFRPNPVDPLAIPGITPLV